MAIEHADFEGVERLAAVTGGATASTFDHPELAVLGECKKIEEVRGSEGGGGEGMRGACEACWRCVGMFVGFSHVISAEKMVLTRALRQYCVCSVCLLCVSVVRVSFASV